MFHVALRAPLPRALPEWIRQPQDDAVGSGSLQPGSLRLFAQLGRSPALPYGLCEFHLLEEHRPPPPSFPCALVYAGGACDPPTLSADGCVGRFTLKLRSPRAAASLFAFSSLRAMRNFVEQWAGSGGTPAYVLPLASLTAGSRPRGAPDSWEIPTCPACLELIDSAATGVMRVNAPAPSSDGLPDGEAPGVPECAACRVIAADARRLPAEPSRTMTGTAPGSTPECMERSRRGSDCIPNGGDARAVGDVEVVGDAQAVGDVPSDGSSDLSSDASSDVPSVPIIDEGVGQTRRGARGRNVPCMACASFSDTWVCLVCGYQGCGRRNEGRHAYAHFRESGHRFCCHPRSGYVWDYGGDRYVHRRVQLACGSAVHLHHTAEEELASTSASQADFDAFCSELEAVALSQLERLRASSLLALRQEEAEFVQRLQDIWRSCDRKVREIRAAKARLAGLEARKLALADELASAREATRAQEDALTAVRDLNAAIIKISTVKLGPTRNGDSEILRKKLEELENEAKSLREQL